MKKQFLYICFLCTYLFPFLTTGQNVSDNATREQKFYKINTISLPDSIILEVGGMAFMDEDKLAVCTRRGEIWIINNSGGNSGRGLYPETTTNMLMVLW
jgi:hypothetical protein